MPRGGARNRSGPQADETSGRSDRRGYSLTALPPAGYDGEAPDFPLPQASDRELSLWVWAWTTPQACAWSDESWRWYTVAEWVRWSVKAEAEDASAAVIAAKIRLADQIGMTPAGLKENGWKIAEPESKADSPTADPDDDEDDPRNRLTVVPDAETG